MPLRIETQTRQISHHSGLDTVTADPVIGSVYRHMLLTKARQQIIIKMGLYLRKRILNAGSQLLQASQRARVAGRQRLAKSSQDFVAC